jgi:hypothetical protein
MADESVKLRAALLQREEAVATLTKERAAMLKDIERFKENMKRGDQELRKAIGASCLRGCPPCAGPPFAPAPLLLPALTPSGAPCAHHTRPPPRLGQA